MDAVLDSNLSLRPISSRARWGSRLLTAVPALFLFFDAAVKLADLPGVRQACTRIGLPDHLIGTVAVVELACLGLYLIPRTAVLGAVLLTGFLGGAVVVHLRLDDPLFTHVLFPVYVGALLWGGLFLRDARVRALFSASP